MRTEMRKNSGAGANGGRRKVRLFRTDRGREMTVDFLTGVGLFCMVALFAGVHEAPALPQPLAKTEAAIAETQQEVDQAAATSTASAGQQVAMLETPRAGRYYAGETTAAASPAADSGDRGMLLIMALVFSSLSAVTFQFWRHLRREYAAPRRKRSRT
jgi:hypothetical protein